MIEKFRKKEQKMQKAGWKIDQNDEGTETVFEVMEISNSKSIWFGNPSFQQLFIIISIFIQNVCLCYIQSTACYIDIDEDEECSSDDLEREYSDWNYLPVNLLEVVFSYLTVKQKYYASLVSVFWWFLFRILWAFMSNDADVCSLCCWIV